MSDLGETRADDDIEVVDLGCLAACALLARNALLSGTPRMFQYGVLSAVYMVMEVQSTSSWSDSLNLAIFIEKTIVFAALITAAYLHRLTHTGLHRAKET